MTLETLRVRLAPVVVPLFVYARTQIENCREGTIAGDVMVEGYHQLVEWGVPERTETPYISHAWSLSVI